MLQHAGRVDSILDLFLSQPPFDYQDTLWESLRFGYIQELNVNLNDSADAGSLTDSMRSLLKKNDPSVSSSKMGSVRRKLYWPFSESKTKALVEDVGRHRQTLALALSADTMSALLAGLSQQRAISNAIDDIRSRIIVSSMNEARRKVLKSFSQGTEPQKNLFAALKLRQMGTGRWISQNELFQTWMSSNRGRLYLTGIPGAGKTVLCATIIEEVVKHARQGQKGSAVAYYFCDYKDAATHDPRSILASLAGQFAAQDEECYAVAEALSNEHRQDDDSISLYAIEELQQCLLGMIETLDYAYIVVDALDECMDNRLSVVEALHNLNDFENEKVKTLFTGRDELYLSTALNEYERLSIAANSHDIRLYVDSEIARRTKNGTLRIRDSALKEEIGERLVIGAEGMFRWVACQIDNICALSNDRLRRKALDSLPPDLPTTYERVLENVNASNKGNQLIVQRTLRWILWAVEPLSLAALSEAISINFGDTTLERDALIDPEAILHWCGSLVRRTPGADTLELAHYSVKEFLEQIDIHSNPQFSDYRADLSHDGLMLAKTCLTYLRFNDFDIDYFEDSQKMMALMRTYKFLRYCVQNWDKHARVKEEDSSLLDILKGFLNPSRPNQYLAWLSCIACIRNETSEITNTEDHDEELEPLANKKNVDRLLSVYTDSSPLHWAATLSLPSLCRWLIGANGSVDQQSNSVGSPLLRAVSHMSPIFTLQEYVQTPSMKEIDRRRKYQTAKALIEAGADCNQRIRYSVSSRKFSILSEVLKGDFDVEIVQLLIDSGFLCDTECVEALAGETGEGLKIFQRLKENNIEESALPHFRKLALSVNMGWDLVLMSTDAQVSKGTLRGIEFQSVFLHAAKFGRLQAMERLMPMIGKGEDSVDINMALNREKDTALHVACHNNHPEIVNILTREDINLDVRDAEGKTALAVAVEMENLECATILLQHGADVRVADNTGSTAFHAAASQTTPRMLDTLMQSSIPEGPSLYTRTKEGQTLLLTAALFGSLPVIEYILEHFEEASLHDRMQDGTSCLHFAAYSGSLPAVSFFLDHDLSPNDWNQETITPVFNAIESRGDSTQIVKLLHSKGADLNATYPSNGAIALFYQIRSRQTPSSQNALDCFNFLLDHTEDVNHCDTRGRNALHHLSKALPNPYPSPYVENICLALMKRGCSMTKCNDWGISAFHQFVQRWSQVEFDARGRFIFRHDPTEEMQDESGNFCEFSGMRSQVSIILFILKHAEAEARSLGEPNDVHCNGAGLLSLAIRTADKDVITSVLKFDSNVDRRDERPGFGNLPLRTPLEWMCAVPAQDMDLIKTFLKSSHALEQQGIYGFAPIHIAASYGNVEVLTELLDMGIHVDCLTSSGMTPLMCACDGENLEAIELLYRRGAQRVLINDRHNSLSIACQNGSKDVFSTLFDLPEFELNLEKGFDCTLQVSTKTIVVEDMTCFHLAACLGQLDILRWFTSKGIIRDIDHVVGEGKLTALYLAADAHEETLQFLLQNGADLSIKCTKRQRTALHAAAEAGHLENIKFLLAHGADATVRDTRLFTPHLVALECKRMEAATLLLEHMPPKEDEACDLLPSDKEGIPPESLSTPLHSSAELGKVHMVRKLLDNGADINSRGFDCITPVMEAARGGHLSTLDLLKERGADFGARDIWGSSALHYACQHDRILVVPGLLELGLAFADVDLENDTSVYYAINNSRPEMNKFVMRHCSITQQTSSQQSGLIAEAAWRESAAMVKWILDQLDSARKHEALNNNSGRYGPALHISAAFGNVNILELILNAGADIDRWSPKLGSPLAYACTMGRFEAVRVLAKRGARLTHVMPDGAQRSAIDAAKSYPKIQHWLRDFYKVQILEAGSGTQDQTSTEAPVEDGITIRT